MATHLPPKFPTKDPWYSAPPGYETAKPGTILRMRVAPGTDTNIFKNCEAIYNILFATTNGHYKPAWAVTTLLVPRETDGHAMLSYQIPYNSPNPDYSPSYVFHSLQNHAWSYMIGNMDVGLERGWFVNFPDHEGHKAAFGNGIVEGHTTLDSVRAAMNAGFGMNKERTKVCFWGFSGGAVASTWAAELQPHYAPELICAGAALGGLPRFLDRCLAIFSGTTFAGLVPNVLLGVTRDDPEAEAYLLSQLKEDRKSDFLRPLHYFIDTTIGMFAGENIWDYFINGDKVLTNPLIRRALSRTRVGFHGVPTMPLFFYKAINDELAPVEDTDDLVTMWGQQGVNILSERNTEGIHIAESHNGRPRAIEWMKRVMDGLYDHKGVTVRDVTITVDGKKDITTEDILSNNL